MKRGFLLLGVLLMVCSAAGVFAAAAKPPVLDEDMYTINVYVKDRGELVGADAPMAGMWVHVPDLGLTQQTNKAGKATFRVTKAIESIRIQVDVPKSYELLEPSENPYTLQLGSEEVPQVPDFVMHKAK